MGHPQEVHHWLHVETEPQVATWVVAHVELAEDSCLVLLVNGQQLQGRRAVSCLVRPERGDKVGVLVDPHGTHHVMAVLEREERKPVELHVAGELRVQAGSRLELAAGERLRWRAPLMEAVGGRLLAVAKEIQALGAQAHLGVKAVRVVADCIDTLAERVGLHARQSQRHIEGVDQQRCGHLDLQAEHVAQLRAGTTLMKSRDLTKIDAKQIQMG